MSDHWFGEGLEEAVIQSWLDFIFDCVNLFLVHQSRILVEAEILFCWFGLSQNK